MELSDLGAWGEDIVWQVGEVRLGDENSGEGEVPVQTEAAGDLAELSGEAGEAGPGDRAATWEAESCVL